MRTVLSALLVALPLAACALPADDGVVEEGWHPAGKADDAGPALRFQSYDVLFTNPLCREYTYPNPVPTADGSAMLTHKPKNVWCSREDLAASADRPTSPQHQLLTWLDGLGAGDEVFLAYLSFSNAAVGDKLCEIAQAGAKVTFVLDARSAQADRVEACGGEILLRGHAGSIGFAHNKIVLINPHGGSEFMKMAFSSGNMSSGVVTHHENWHFIDVARDTYFAQDHLCLMEAQVSAEASAGRAAYRDALDACRATIDAEPESDIKSFFIPHSNDRKRAQRYLLGAVADAAEIDLGAHRFSHSGLIDKLATKLSAGDLTVRMVADDDLYWVDPLVGDPAVIGANEEFEAPHVQRLADAGGDAFEIRYFETNHGEHLLHHNKYVLYRTAGGAPFGLIAGAANLTKSGYNDNFENIYFIKIPSVLAAFDTQLARVWDGERATPDEQDPPVATPRYLMPASVVAPQ